jgi:hypothetical protein
MTNISKKILYGFGIMSLVVAVLAVNIAKADTASVILQNSTQSSQTVTSDQVNTLNASFQNMTGSDKNVLIDLELYDSNDQRVTQSFFDNVTITASASSSASTTVTKNLSSPANLQAGTYTWRVGIFEPGWANLIAWYHEPLTFTVSNNSGTSTTGDVVLGATVLGESHLDNCPPLTALLTNSGSSSRNVLVDIELRDSSNALTDQYFVDNFSVLPATTSSFTAVTNQCIKKLTPGTYNYSVGIFNPNWNGLMHWYNNAHDFVMSPLSTSTTATSTTGTSTPPITGTSTATTTLPTSGNIQIVRIEMPQNPVAGTTFNIVPTLISPDRSIADISAHVYLVNQSGQTSYETTRMHENLNQNSPNNFPLVVEHVMPGTYTIKLDVMDSGNNILQSFSNLGTITVQ